MQSILYPEFTELFPRSFRMKNSIFPIELLDIVDAVTSMERNYVFIYFIEIQLIDNVVLVSDVQYSTVTYIQILFQIIFLYRLLQNTEQLVHCAIQRRLKLCFSIVGRTGLAGCTGHQKNACPCRGRCLWHPEILHGCGPIRLNLIGLCPRGGGRLLSRDARELDSVHPGNAHVTGCLSCREVPITIVRT